MNELRRLLILSNTRRNRPNAELMPTIERYDGPLYTVLRHYVQSTPSHDLAILILSARYGLIPASTRIPSDDHVMKKEHVADFHGTSEQRVAEYTRRYTIIASCICMGATYRAALGNATEQLQQTGNCTIIRGGIGMMQNRLRDWLTHAGEAQ